jgi:hypothetical protein
MTTTSVRSQSLPKGSGTTNIDLFILAKKYNIQLDHILYRNEVPMLKYKPNLSIIINMSVEGHPGTHWVAMRTYKDFIFYSDSFGVEPPLEVVDWANKYRKNIVYNDYQLELLTGTNCGQLALFTLGLSQGKVVKSLLD